MNSIKYPVFYTVLLAACSFAPSGNAVQIAVAGTVAAQSANLHRIDLAQAAWVLQLWFIAALLLLAPALRRD